MRNYNSLEKVFEQDGFIYIKEFMSSQEMDELEMHVLRFIQDIVPTLSNKEAMYEDYKIQETLKQIGNLEVYEPFFADLLSRPKFVGLAEVLLQDAVIPQFAQYFSKPPGIGKPTPPHQDGYYFCLVPNEALTVWIPLDDMDEENGALHYVKGSHKHGVLPHAASHVLGFSQGIKEGRKTELGEEVTCQVQRGDCLIHH
ncbi:MAG: phytanoyl-CoA dioxygenase family protein, partial [Acidobacteria bacterium]|nr:phytanoyl-CoA dioxygenase family protein [Acidobacteriota bacterium]